MKKKGLIISTVVMVVVLIASLTTATYAWFQTSSVTSINGFNLSVQSDNAVNIGIKKDYTSTISSNTNTVASSHFVTGNVTFAPGTAGSLTSPGLWTSSDGLEGLSASLSHNINWTSQSMAVGVSTDSSLTVGDDGTVTGATLDNTNYWVGKTIGGTSAAESGKVIAANGNDSGLSKAKTANANIKKDGENELAGDYVHFILGVTPNRDLERNNLVILVEHTNGANLGVLASIHVAYRVTKDGDTALGAWKEVDVYGSNTYKTVASELTTNASDTAKKAYEKTYTEGSTTAQIKNGSYAVEISGLDLEKGKISQVELVIYMSGADPDCNDTGKSSEGEIKLFFDTANAITATNSATNLVVNCNEESYSQTNTSIYTTTSETVDTSAWNAGSATKIEGTWNKGTFTSTAAIDSAAKNIVITNADGSKVIKVIKL